MNRTAAVLLMLAGCLLLAGACSDADTSGTAGQGVRLNELLALSATQDDWLELVNTSDTDVLLQGYVLQDQSNYWVFPATTIKAHGFLQVVCDGSGVGGKASFKLTSEGERVMLKDSAGVQLDSVVFPAMTADTSWGRLPDGTGAWASIKSPSPGASNTSGARLDGGVADRSQATPDSAAGKTTGAACSSKEECLSLICHQEICISPYPNAKGQSCMNNGHCLSLACQGGVCVDGTAGPGTACLNSQECLSGSCSSGKCGQGTATNVDAGAGADALDQTTAAQ